MAVIPPSIATRHRGAARTRAWDRTRSFAVRAGLVIVPLVLVLNVLNSVGTDGSLGNEDSDASVLSEIGRTITPLFKPFGVTEENWPASVGIFTGFLAKEAVVGTLDALYAGLGDQDEAAARSLVDPRPRGASTEEALPAADEPLDLLALVGEGLATIPTNLAAAVQGWLDPLGLNIGDVSDPEAAADAQEVAVGTFGAMAPRFGSAARPPPSPTSSSCSSTSPAWRRSRRCGARRRWGGPCSWPPGRRAWRTWPRRSSTGSPPSPSTRPPRRPGSRAASASPPSS